MERKYVLVAEDEWIVGQDLCDTVREAGFDVSVPLPDISSAMLSCQKRRPDIAILDVNLADGTAFGFAEKLLDEDIPVIFHSGAAAGEHLAGRFPQAATLEKQCPPATVLASVHDALRTAR